MEEVTFDLLAGYRFLRAVFQVAHEADLNHVDGNIIDEETFEEGSVLLPRYPLRLLRSVAASPDQPLASPYGCPLLILEIGEPFVWDDPY